MIPETYLSLIREQYPEEDPNDVLTMIDILARARAEARGATLARDDFDFAGKILCVIFDPIKFKIVGFAKETKSLRRAYRGIAESAGAQETFRESLRPDLVSAEEASEAIAAGIEALFRLPATTGEDDDRNEFNAFDG
jgi:hypothetical protein